MNNESPGLIKRIFSRLWTILNTSRKIIVNLIFFGFLFFIILAATDDSGEIIIPEQTALILNLKGQLVEQKHEIDPMEAFLNEAMGQDDPNPEILVSDVVNVINTAKTDDRVKTLVLRLESMSNAGMVKLEMVSDAILDFKKSGKEVIAFGEYYSQSQYYLASYADKVWLVPNGMMLLEGFGRYQMYYKSALEKLDVSQHIFRVGTFKSAVEPYIRDDMSPAAKEANELWLADLWSAYKEDVSRQRGFNPANFDESIETLLTKFKAADANFATYALQNNWVDELLTHEKMREQLTALVGATENQKSFNQIGFKDYLKATTNPFPFENPVSDKVAVVVAKGVIQNGHKKPGTIGGASTAKLLREARLDDKVKAVVLRVDSPGGSAYASEIIREEIELLKASGKPVVASMGSVAASGGYWISASANQIWASPNTITGSIGIFGMFMTFEKTLDKIGVHADGVGTTDLSGTSLALPLDSRVGDLIQLSINRGYQDFISLVAENRGMTLEEVDNVAQGRVWSGAKAKELGLVDELGDLDGAIEAAAKLAGLQMYDTKLIEKELSPRDRMLRDLLGQANAWFDFDTNEEYQPSAVTQFTSRLVAELNKFNQFNDPQGVYVLCLACDLN